MRLVRPNIASLRMPTHLLALLAMAVPIKEWAGGRNSEERRTGNVNLERPWNDDRRWSVAPPLRGMDGIARVEAKGEPMRKEGGKESTFACKNNPPLKAPVFWNMPYCNEHPVASHSSA